MNFTAYIERQKNLMVSRHIGDEELLQGGTVTLVRTQTVAPSPESPAQEAVQSEVQSEVQSDVQAEVQAEVQADVQEEVPLFYDVER